jgi:ribose transport system permease protein
MGGRGSVINSFFGVLVIAVLENGLAQLGAPESVKRLVSRCPKPWAGTSQLLRTIG